MLLLDSDNALGSPSGDVDDGFALAMLLTSGLPIAGLASVAGNTDEPRAFANHRTLGELAGYKGRYLRGVGGVRAEPGGEPAERIDEAADLWAGPGEPVRWIALGPLTNLAAVLAHRGLALRIEEVVLVGGNLTSRGRWPPFWPLEFNLTQDRAAARAVFASPLPLTIVPLDVARRLRAGRRELGELTGPLGEHLRRGTRRWLWRTRLLKARGRIALFDLLAAAYVVSPEHVHVEATTARLGKRMLVEYGRGERPVRVVRDFDGQAIWNRFRARVNGQP
ncbi:MAG TPA: nucleoside hydrolase [Thermoanaerobaculia bacterium]|jgi:inosine-uridine nucleoside N-ribohydrolase|nr:nucleoside hydrolase [Thermoanaerobaculia bacterium]